MDVDSIALGKQSGRQTALRNHISVKLAPQKIENQRGRIGSFLSPQRIFGADKNKALEPNGWKAVLMWLVNGTEGRNRTGTVSLPLDFESSASTSFATSARGVEDSYYCVRVQVFFVDICLIMSI